MFAFTDAAVAGWFAIGVAVITGMFALLGTWINRRTLGKKNGHGTAMDILAMFAEDHAANKERFARMEKQGAYNGALLEAHILLDRKRQTQWADHFGIDDTFPTEDEMLRERDKTA